MAKHRRTIAAQAPDAPAEPPRLSLTEQVYDSLKEDILRVRRRPGEIVLEPELAARYGVSKTPIREALRLLVQDRWVTVMPRKGYLVRPLGLDDVREVFSLRQMLEPELVREAAARGDRAAIEGLRVHLEEQTAPDPDGIEAALTSARLFHLAIAEMAGNARAVRILEGLLDEVKRLHYLMPDVEGHITSTVELEAHERILAALLAGDAAQAASVMREHLGEVGRTMVQAFGGVRAPLGT